MDKYTYIANSDGAYIEDLYNSYKQDSTSVDEGWQKFFEGYDFSQKYPVNGNGHTNGAANGKAVGSHEIMLSYSLPPVMPVVKPVIRTPRYRF